MLKLPNILFIIIVFAGLSLSCSDNSTGPGGETGEDTDGDGQVTTGVLEARITTSGSDIDSDGYQLVLNGSDTRSSSVNDTLHYSDLDEGSHQVELVETAENCAVDGSNSRSFDITAGDTTVVSFSVECASQGAPPLINMIAYESSGEGGGYTKLYVMETDGSNPEMLHELDGENVLQPDISPDGTKIVFSAGSFDNYIYVMGSDGTGLTQLTSSDDDGEDYYANDYYPAWSPDGTKIAFERDNEIYVMNADGSEQQNITNTPGSFELNPAWSPDGEQIVYVRGTDDTFNQDQGNLFIMNADGSSPTPLTETAADVDRGPAWSPDGERIAFSRRADGEVAEIFIINADGTNLNQVTERPSGATDYSSRTPAWSPDGSRIAYTGYRSSGTFIHTINPDGSDEAVLDNGTINHGSASWSPTEE